MVEMTYKEVEVTLEHRSDFICPNIDWPILIGRNFLAEDLVIDPSAKFTMKPNCKEALQP
jgi:hypothetical protein